EGYSSSAKSMQYLIGEDEMDISIRSKQLLGFESYEEVTGTKILVGNQLGEMAINQKDDFITEGQGSLMVRPQGDYNDRASYPYFQLDFLDSTCGTNNFSRLREISFDAYNCMAEEVCIRIHFTLVREDGSFVKTPMQSFTLKANGWTHCAYDLSEMSSYAYYDFTNVRYMTFEFLDYKESKADTLNELYIDNLVGMYYVSDNEKQNVTYDFRKGVTFETSGEQYVLFGAPNILQRMDFTRIAYADEGMDVIAQYGDYGMKAEAIGSVFPTFTVRYGEVLSAGVSLSFMAYIDTEADTTFSKIESPGNAVYAQQWGFNKWFEVEIVLNANTDITTVFFNFDDGTGKSILDYNQPITIYLDNLKIYQPDMRKGLTFEYAKDADAFARLMEPGAEWTDATIGRVTYASEGISAPIDGGNYALKLSHAEYSYPRFEINFGEVFPAGTKLTFMAYGVVGGVLESKQTRFEASHDSRGKAVVTSTEDIQEGGLFTVGKWTEITVTLSEAAESVQMFWNFAITEVGDNGNGAVYIDNLKAKVPSPFIEGVDFETEKHTSLFDGWKEIKDGVDYSWADATVDRISYADAGIHEPADGGTYGLKLSHTTFGCPRLEINFGAVLPSKTTITFWAYGVVDGASEGARIRFIPSGTSTGKVVVTSTEDTMESGLFT
ncbi:MAG: hypothetical protein IJA27_00640, partial [Lachnospiraceae bacterium]|nr:hypothetical protein [Lachnospiraceae bacterium]